MKSPFKSFLWTISLFGLLIIQGCDKHVEYSSSDYPYPISEDLFTTDTLTSGLTIPFGLVFLDDNDFLISDRIGKIFRFKEGNLQEVYGVQEVQTFEDPGSPLIIHGGLMDLSLHPDYPTVPWIYVAYFGKDARGKVARFKLSENQIFDQEIIFQTRTEGYYGNGMRIVWEDEEHFFLNIGVANYSTRKNPVLVSQDLKEDWGKIHRLNEDGSIPKDNPILEGYDKPESIYSYGHRDVQGLVYDSSKKTLFGIEHGPKGGDEFNIILPGKNYGWPLFTYGTHYDGEPVSLISRDSAEKISVLPQHYWTVPSSDGGRAIAPSCAILVRNSNFPEWEDHFLIASLAFQRLLKFDPKTGDTFGLKMQGRIRSIYQEQGGNLLLLVERNDITKSNGKLVRVRKPN
ncbi:MAG: PQQ-dependent sugar dehydrogenase [Cyclobacteriaceae bacterium]|nr:PQQ-dependent sugar dehydrogenase [Cyclobacteriaceae bacterium]